MKPNLNLPQLLSDYAKRVRNVSIPLNFNKIIQNPFLDSKVKQNQFVRYFKQLRQNASKYFFVNTEIYESTKIKRFFGSNHGYCYTCNEDVVLGEILLVDKGIASLPPFKEIEGVNLGTETFTNIMEVMYTINRQRYDNQFSELYYQNEELKDLEKFQKNSYSIVCQLQETYNYSYYQLPEANCSTLYYLASFLNHSCEPNIQLVEIGDVFVGVAARPIKQGEELFSTYVDAFESLSGANYVRNRGVLQKSYGFDCDCGICTLLTSEQFETLESLAVSFKDAQALFERGQILNQIYAFYEKTALKPRHYGFFYQLAMKFLALCRASEQEELAQSFALRLLEFYDIDVMEAAVRGKLVLKADFLLQHPLLDKFVAAVKYAADKKLKANLKKAMAEYFDRFYGVVVPFKEFFRDSDFELK